MAEQADQDKLVTREDITWSHGLDVPGRSLKVATRVRIPLGLLHSSWSERCVSQLDSTVSIHLPIVPWNRWAENSRHG